MVNQLEKLMQSYFDRGRSTPGAAQEKEFDLPFGKKSKKKQNKKNKK